MKFLLIVIENLDMRKALSRDVHKESVVPLGRDVYPHELY